MPDSQTSIQVKTDTLRKAVGASADIAKLWFESRAEPISRKQFDARVQLRDTGTGSVYAYYGPEGSTLYVGQTGRFVKARLHDPTSPHKLKEWWPKWNQMRFIQLPDEMDRLVLEFLLILAYGPPHNEKPKAKDLALLLPT